MVSLMTVKSDVTLSSLCVEGGLAMQNVLGRGLSSEEITDIQRLAESSKTATVRDLLLRVASLSGSGNGILSIAEDRTYTPAEAAKRIGMSRTHLYKLLDRGALPSHRVGSHRKIFASDLKALRRNGTLIVSSLRNVSLMNERLQQQLMVRLQICSDV